MSFVLPQQFTYNFEVFLVDEHLGLVDLGDDTQYEQPTQRMILHSMGTDTVGSKPGDDSMCLKVMPWVIRLVGMDETVGGAWIGGTIDSTGAVAAAGLALGERGLEVAALVKMIQNVLIGVFSFAIATYWVTCVEKDPQGKRPKVSEIWKRFPRFVLGFISVSILCSLIDGQVENGSALMDGVIKGSTKTLREWLFCLAFVSIGLETNFRELSPYLKGGKPLILYLCGQALNLTLTLLMAYLMFGVLFRDTIKP
jgi:uncharacterized membrane protein YadS